MEVLNLQLDPERPLFGDCWGDADCAVQAHLSDLPLVFPEFDLSPCSVIQAVIERTHLRPAFKLVMGFARSLIIVPLFDDWRFNRCMGG